MDLPTTRSGQTTAAVARECAAAAQAIIRPAFGRAGVAAVKGRGNVVTETDLAVEQAVSQILRDAFPEHSILSEETASDTRTDGWMWVIDPLDGTKNFSRGIPHFCYTMALCFEMAPRFALTLHPLLGDEFVATLGGGATLNGEPMSVSAATTVRESVLGVDLGYDDARGRRQLELASALWPGMEALRVSGSAALGMAYAAAGKWDLFVHANLQPWDIAAGLLLVREAGGIVTDRDGLPATLTSDSAVAGSPGVHADLFALAGSRPWRA